MRRAVLLAAVFLLALAAGCGDDDGASVDASPPDAGLEPIFPADYASTYTEVRDCRSSSSHDFHKIKIWADEAAVTPYLERNAPFPVGSIVLKEEFDIGDMDCTGDIIQWSVMQRLEEGTGGEFQLDWLWQQVDQFGLVVTENDSRCFGCHDDCDGNPVDSYENTCAVP